MKISYSCMPNMYDIVKAHNEKVLAEGVEMNRSCSYNCRRKDQRPPEGNCQAKSIVYKATVNNNEGTKQYIGLTENRFKQRYSSHLQSIRHEKYEPNMELSKYVWRMKRSSKDTNIKWSIQS